MNIIQKQADEFIMYHMNDHEGHKEFIDNVRTELWEYKKVVYQVEFVQRIIQKAKIEYDNHLKICTNPKSCMTNKFYENSLFFCKKNSKN